MGSSQSSSSSRSRNLSSGTDDIDGSSSIFNRTKHKISSLFCGAFAPRSNHELEDFPEKSPNSLSANVAQTEGSLNSIIESSSVFTSEAGDTSSMLENEGSSGGNSSIIDEVLLESSSLNAETSSEPFPHPPAGESISGGTGDSTIAVVDPRNTMTEGTNAAASGHDHSTGLAEWSTFSLADSYDLRYHRDAVMGVNYSDLRSLSFVSDAIPRFQLPGDDDAHMTSASSSGFLVSDSDQDLTSGDMLHLDMVSISSDLLSSSIAEINSRESRRNNRRLFWDALSRRSFRRHSDTPTIVFATGLADDLGSHDRWLLDLSGDLPDNQTARDLDSLGARRHRRNERRLLFRSEFSERNIGGHNEGGQQTAVCASGLHPDGTCSCDSFFTAEESRSLASISRIIMLAEALFEVLDEIHAQSLSLSLSTLSLPAPESLVDTFPIKYYKKIKNDESNSSDVPQCYICLADYEDGDKLRVLPCNHEFHVPCIDKWLKEVNRVCPLCRHNVCEGPGECSVSNA